MLPRQLNRDWAGWLLNAVAAHPVPVIVLIFLSDYSMNFRNNDVLRAALQDEPCHLLTAALVLVLVAGRLHPSFLRAALAGSVLLDVDHIPLETGLVHIPAATGRPYTHSLLFAGAVFVAAILLKRGGPMAGGLACGFVLHMARDLATGPLPLLWPAVPAGIGVPYPIYAAFLVLLAGFLTWSPRSGWDRVAPAGRMVVRYTTRSRS